MSRGEWFQPARRNQKLVVMGPAKTGKSSILARYLYDSFSETYQPTQGLSYVLKETEAASVGFFDTSGAPRYTTLLSENYLPGASGILLVLSAEAAPAHRAGWKKDLEEYLGIIRKRLDVEPGIPITIFINKSDLLDDQVDIEAEKEVLRNLAGVFPGTEIQFGSAKNARNIKAPVDALITRIGERVNVDQGVSEAFRDLLDPLSGVSQDTSQVMTPSPSSSLGTRIGKMHTLYKVAIGLALVTIIIAGACAIGAPALQIKIPFIVTCALWKFIAVTGAALTGGTLMVPSAARLLGKCGSFAHRKKDTQTNFSSSSKPKPQRSPGAAVSATTV